MQALFVKGRGKAKAAVFDDEPLDDIGRLRHAAAEATARRTRADSLRACPRGQSPY